MQSTKEHVKQNSNWVYNHGKYELKTRHNKIKHINQIHAINNHNILINGKGKKKKKTEEWN